MSDIEKVPRALEDDDVCAKNEHEPSLGSGVSSKQEWLYTYCIFFVLFAAGWNDASTGPLLLTIQAHYGVTYLVVSILFICNFIGFFSAALLNVWLTDRLGFGKTILLGATLQMVSYAMQSPAPPFPLYLISFAVAGFGVGLQDAQGNTFISRMSDVTTKMSLTHAAYGFGALVSPLVATQFASMPRYWHYHYLVSLGIGAINVAWIAARFRLRREDDLLNITLHDGSEEQQQQQQAAAGGDLEIVPTASPPTSGNKMSRIMRKPMVHTLAFYTLVYVGAEVTIGGWTVAYLQEVRGAGESAGYVSSGFFGGLTLGRVAHVWLCTLMDENLLVLVYALLAIALEVVVWQVPSVVGGAIAVSFVGFALGPMYPVIMNVTTAVLPGWMAGGAIGWIASFGQAGSALWPFATGALASRYGSPWVLQPLLIALLAFLGVVWIVVLWAARKQLKQRPLFPWRSRG